MSDFLRAWPIVIGIEAGLVDDPNDPGGLTKYGICQRDYPNVDIRNLTEVQAQAILQRDFWNVGRCDYLPWPLNCLLFEADVNCGAGTGGRLLQEALGVAVDGSIGPITIKVAGTAKLPDLVARFQAKLGVRYAGLPKAASFLEGWLYREFLGEYQALQG
jgi:lysozyme family protein